MITAFLLALAPALQEVQGPPPPPIKPTGEWRVLNSAALIVNEDIITEEAVREDVRRFANQRGLPINTEEDFRRIQIMVVQEKVKESLEEQAGRVLGFDQKMIDRFVEDEERKQREAAGSISNLAEILKSQNIDSTEFRKEARERVDAQLWVGSVTGRYAGPSGRPAHDRYVRPGRLLFEYRANESKLIEQGEAGVLLLEMSLPITGTATPEQMRASFEELRRRVLAGEDFGTVAEEAHACKPKTFAALPPIPISSLKARFPEVLQFVQSAKPGDVSEVLESQQANGAHGLRLIKLLELIPERNVSFEEREIQSAMTKFVQSTLDEYRTSTGLQNLLEAAYVWPPESFKRPTATPKQP